MDDAILYKNLLDELNCPVCFDYMQPPIRQCSKGHSLCNLCCNQLKRCPLCTSEFTEVRNLSLEALAARIKYPCTNEGCDAKVKLSNRDYHKKVCTFGKYKCGLDTCDWQGSIHEVASHWESKQLGIKPYKETNMCQIKIESQATHVNLITAHNQLFYFKCKIICGKIYFAVQYIGPANKAEGYYYTILIYKPEFPKRSLQLRDYCHSILLDDTALYQSGGCAFVTNNSLDKYVGIDKILGFSLMVNPVSGKGANPDNKAKSGSSKT